MKAWEFDVVTYGGEYFCNDCLPLEVDEDDDGVMPVFACEETDSVIICQTCGKAHDYTTRS